MSVKKLLSSQNAGFTNMRDLLTRMGQLDGATYQEAATVLYRLLLADEAKSPKFWVRNSLQGVRQANQKEAENALAVLKEHATVKEPLVIKTVDAAHSPQVFVEYGFIGDEFMNYMATHGIDIKGTSHEALSALSGDQTSPTADLGLRDALAISERERSAWKVKALELEVMVDDRASQRAEIERLRGELRNANDQAAQLTSENSRLRADALAGKTKTTALKIIGGMAIKGYGMDIHASRLTRIGDLVGDLQRAGAGVSEKTLRDWIKEASTVVERQKAKS